MVLSTFNCDCQKNIVEKNILMFNIDGIVRKTKSTASPIQIIFTDGQFRCRKKT